MNVTHRLNQTWLNSTGVPGLQWPVPEEQLASDLGMGLVLGAARQVFHQLYSDYTGLGLMESGADEVLEDDWDNGEAADFLGFLMLTFIVKFDHFRGLTLL